MYGAQPGTASGTMYMILYLPLKVNEKRQGSAEKIGISYICGEKRPALVSLLSEVARECVTEGVGDHGYLAFGEKSLTLPSVSKLLPPAMRLRTAHYVTVVT